jgi:hypothetical protein
VSFVVRKSQEVPEPKKSALGSDGWWVDSRGVSGKSAKVAARVAGLDSLGWDPRYMGWFDCFNRGEFYEAHDVLEDLWLEQGKGGSNHRFYKGLIQFAGAFVHLQKARPGPAIALFRLADANFVPYPEFHDGIDLARVRALGAEWIRAVEISGTDCLVNRPRPSVEPPAAKADGERG